uniref:Protein polybromo-1 n=1 Tax=Bursaphelenchus xylophilus TaxID=6326 RepID=A0A1I7S1Y9_BURXY
MSTKRRKTEDGATPGRKRARKEPGVDQSSLCQALFNAIKAARDESGALISETFMRAPSRRSDPEYHNAIQKPIDIGRISQKLNSDDYGTFEEICDDFELLIKNSLSYYKADSQERKHAIALQRVFHEERDKILFPEEETNSKTAKNEPIEEWRLQAVVCAILDLTDKQGRLLCPPFRVLAPRDKFPEYYEAVQNPIDLQKIGQKIRNGEYASWKEFQDDLRLLFRNAKTFNEPGSVIYKDAVQLNQFANAKCNELKDSKKMPAKEANKNKETIEELLSQSYEADEDTISEDSDDENQESVSEEMRNLYWKVRDHKKDGRELSESFMALPEKVHYPDYYEEITDPVSFYLVNKRMKTGTYESIGELVEDIHKIFCNAMTYNVPQSDIYEDAAELETFLIKTVKEMGIEVDIKPFTDPPEDEEEEESLPAPPTPVNPPKKGRKSKVEMTGSPSPAPSSPSVTRQSAHRLSITSDDNSNLDQSSPGSPKKKRGIPPSRLPTAIESRKLLIPKRLKRDPNGPKMKPGRKSFNELRERYKQKLMEVVEGLQSITEGGRRICKEFLFPPSPKDFPEYYEAIKNPIDLTQIKHRIQNGDYKVSDEFMDDIRLMCRNARHFNEPGSQIYKDANTLEKQGLHLLGIVTNNTSLHCPPPSKKQPTYFNGDLDEEVPYVYKPSPKIKKERPPPTPSRLNGLQHHMLSILDAISNCRGDNNRLLSDKFMRLPSRAEYPEYYDIIKKPMDLSRIRHRIVYKPYDSLRLFLNELNLVFENACKFNEPDSEIYRDAITLQKELMEIKAELFEESTVPSVQVQVKRILTNLLVYVNTYAENERVLADSFADVKDLFAKNGLEVAEMPFTFDQLKINVDKGRYRRLDRFQDDLFALFAKVRQLTSPTSQIFEDSIKLQLAFINKREELCKTVLVSPASTYNESMLNDEVDEQRKEHRLKLKEEKKLEKEKDENQDLEQQEGLESVEKDGIEYSIGDYVYVSSEKEQRHILRIQSIKRVPEENNELLISGIWVYKPAQTFHLATRKFYPNEVFLTEFPGSVTVDRLKGKCAVMFVDDYCTSEPKGFESKDIYVCDHQYLGRRLHFRRLSTWPYPEDAEKLKFEARPEEITVEKTETSEFVNSEVRLLRFRGF